MYKLIHDSADIIRISDSTVIPADTTLPEYMEFIDWLVAGNTPESADPIIPVIPQSVSMRQARLALLELDILDQVPAAIAGIEDPKTRTQAEIEWEYATTVQRDSPLTQMLAYQLGLTETQLDELFTLAATL